MTEPSEGRCTDCGQWRPLFRYTPDHEAHYVPRSKCTPTRDLCTRCWSDARADEDRAAYTDFADVFANGSDEDVLGFISGGTR